MVSAPPSKLPSVSTSIFTVMSDLATRHGAINLSQGFPNFNPPARLMDLVYAHMRAGHNQYAPMPGLPILREKLADKISWLYGATVNPQTEITITSGATQALYTAINTFVRPGDEVILIDPAYDLYRPAVIVNGGVPVAYALRKPDFRIDWQELGKLIRPQTRMIVLNTPHNPTGTVLQESDWQALEELLAPTDILLLCDEAYEHLIYDGHRHESSLRYPALFSRTLATFSFGKTFHATGWKVGFCVAPEELMMEFRKIHQFTVFSVHSPSQYALADFLDDPSGYTQLPAFYQAKRDLLQNLLAPTPLQPLPCTGTYFQLYDYSAFSQESDISFARRMTIEFGVAAIPVSVFYEDGRDEHLIRLCFAKTEDLLRAAGEKLQKALR